MINLLLVLGLVASVVWGEAYRRKCLYQSRLIEQAEEGMLKAIESLQMVDKEIDQANAVIKQDQETIKYLLACLEVKRAFEGDTKR